MSSGNFDLTTYYAKRIIGDAAAATAANALLQTGDDITSNTWILHRTNRTTEKYGIHYAYDGTNGHDKIEFYGKGTNDDATAWVQLDTGNASFNNINSYGTITTMTLFLKNTTTDLTQSNNGSDNTIYHSIWGADKNNKTWFCVEGYTNSSGSVAAFLGVRNYNTDGVAQSWKGFTITEDKSNNLTYTVSDPHAFRSAISTWALVSDSYNTFMPADGTTNGWYKFGTSNTSYGILPSASGGAGSGHNYIGTSTWYWKYSYIDEMYGRNLTISGNNNGIYFTGTAATQQMIKFIDANDAYGSGISIGGGGLTILGSGESANTLFSNLSVSGAAETTYIAADNSIEFYPSQNGYDASARIWMTASVLNIGVDGNTTRESSVNVYSGAGRIQLYSAASATGNRGLWVAAHGTGAAKTVITVDTNNNVTLNGNAATATNADKLDNVDSRGFLRVYLNSTDITSIDTVAADNYLYSHSDSGGFCSGTKPTGSHNGTAILHIRPHNDNYAQQIAFDTNQSAIWYRNANASTTFSAWTRIVTNSGTWSISVTGSSGSCTGNAATASSVAWSGVTGKALDGINTSDTAYVMAPGGAYYKNGGGTVTGAIKITLPVFKTSTMIRFYVDIYTYDGSSATTYLISGYNYSDQNWYNFAAKSYGNNTAKANLKVRFGDDGSKSVIWIGETNTSWAYPQVRVRDVMLGHSGYNATNFNTGWTITFVTSFGTVKQTVSTPNDWTFTKVYGAVWNDYAEFRRTNDKAIPGQVVIDNDDGTLSLTTKRLQLGAQVVTDTFGFAIGETDETKTPLAVSGRVLVYTYRDRYEYHAGQAVCSAPDGTVDIMSRDEIMMYPDAIVGIVSEIPEYEEWGTGKIKVNNRIWIKVK